MKRLSQTTNSNVNERLVLDLIDEFWRNMRKIRLLKTDCLQLRRECRKDRAGEAVRRLAVQDVEGDSAERGKTL